MSMNGQFRQISPRALDLLLQRPELVSAVLEWQAAEALAPAVDAASTEAGTDVEADPLADVPAELRGMFESLPEDMRQMALQQFRAVSAMLPFPLAAGGMYDEEVGEIRGAGIGDGDLPAALDLDQRWHGLHFLLTGEAGEAPGPLGLAVLGGREVGEDLGYGAARVLTPGEVAVVTDALEGITDDDLLARYAPAGLEAEGVYPAGWEEEEEERRQWLLDAFHQVRGYYAAARARGYGMLLAVT